MGRRRRRRREEGGRRPRSRRSGLSQAAHSGTDDIVGEHVAIAVEGPPRVTYFVFDGALSRGANEPHGIPYEGEREVSVFEPANVVPEGGDEPVCRAYVRRAIDVWVGQEENQHVHRNR